MKRRLLALPLLCVTLASGAWAAPGFIESSSVEKGDLYTEISVRFRCKVQLLGYDPAGKSDFVRISLQPTTVCVGGPPSIALNREILRPPGADIAALESIEYDGQSVGQETLRLDFEQTVTVDVQASTAGDGLTIRVFAASDSPPLGPPRAFESGTSRRVDNGATEGLRYVINLQSSLQPPVVAEGQAIDPGPDQELMISAVEMDDQTWYRLRIGYFASAEAAARALANYRETYPKAWVDHERASGTALPVPTDTTTSAGTIEAAPAPASDVDGEVPTLMQEARQAMIAGELPAAIQLYTKVLRQPVTGRHAEAQEYLALARERNGQLAHAKAEYETYLAQYPDAEGADRVRQRLAALLSGPAVAAADERAVSAGVAAARGEGTRKIPSRWKTSTYVSQYYRRDVNQLNDENEIVSQSSIYTDGSIDARRRGERFDLALRLTGGYRTDLLGEEEGGQGNDFRWSYAYTDLVDSGTRISARFGRQTRNSGGVLGRFDGLNLNYELTERLELQAVGGIPVYSTTHDDPMDRRFYGVSVTVGPMGENLDVTAFYLQQDVESLTDRRAIGAEVRYFGRDRTVWGMLDYDIEFSEISSSFLQTSWRLPGGLSLSGLFDHRRSPYLALGNAVLGQPDQDFNTLLAAWTEEEIRRLALDRSAATTTITLGVSRPITPRLQLGLNATRSVVEATPESGGAAALPESEYSYYSLDLVASSLFREGDVSIVNLRQSGSGTTDVLSMNVDARFPIGRSWRIGPRMRVDRREIRSDGSEEWIYSPGLRMQYRPLRSMRFELTGGKEFSSREMVETDFDRESYFIYLGYQWFR